MVRIRYRILLLALAVCLLISLIPGYKSNALTAAEYCLYIENNTAENLIIFVDGELDSVVRSNKMSEHVACWTAVVDIKYQDDFNIELKNGFGDVVYHTYLGAEELESEDITLVIPPSVGAPSVDMSGMQEYSVRIHNPSDETVVVIINGIPIDVISGHVGIYSSCWLYTDEEGNNQQLIETRNSQGALISSLTPTLSEISSSGWIITLPSSTPVTFSLNFVNLSSQSLAITINGQTIGSIVPDTEKLFEELEVEPRMEWRPEPSRTSEKYLIEAKSTDSTIYYSKDISWYAFDIGSDEQKWTIVIPPELRVRNLTSEMIIVYVTGQLMGYLEPLQEESFYGYRMVTDYSLRLMARNISGQTVFSKRYSYTMLQNVNWLLVIIPFNWTLLWSVVGGFIVLFVVVVFIVLRRRPST
ncbi:MAG: hypothetical protein JSV77_09920 [Dehalococcoidales bacterium]|nr:MAG: hypothetical protein JSV77_09920 [Dehalococcoidales bacterium]